MKLLLILLFTYSISYGSSIEEVRQNFWQVESIEKTEFYIDQLESEKSIEGQGYLAGMYFMKSRYAGFPLTKMKYFKKGKNLLDELIVTNPENIELRYLRLIMQYQIPEFLGYHENKESDFLYIQTNIENSALSIEFKHQILDILIQLDNMPKDKIEVLKIVKDSL